MAEQKPSIGRVVVFNEGSLVQSPALVIKAYEQDGVELVDLVYFSAQNATQFVGQIKEVVEGEEKGNRWEWPVRV